MINKQSNVYTIVYIVVMVLIVGTALAFTAMALRDRQQENKNADKMSQILQSVHLTTDRATVVEEFNKYITRQIVLNDKGEELQGKDAFDIDVAAEVKKPVSERLLPVYVCELPGKGTKYIIPMSGMGLWGPIWGYISFNADGSTIYGAVFRHEGETPGLGAEIAKPAFSDQFDNKTVIKDNTLIPVEVVKKGLKPEGNADYVDGISGGTITSKGVSAMLNECLTPYKSFLEGLASGSATAETQPQQTH
ncbi:MAG: NADH:ubiquinone reductase (Na(+)-transporting) subunit C [Muribaculaceae bacterium]|nr:NADH:ubiquinone reductase (Na(+)-transporting) subunit C [Muribaculaceae bacterium]